MLCKYQVKAHTTIIWYMRPVCYWWKKATAGNKRTDSGRTHFYTHQEPDACCEVKIWIVAPAVQQRHFTQRGSTIAASPFVYFPEAAAANSVPMRCSALLSGRRTMEFFRERRLSPEKRGETLKRSLSGSGTGLSSIKPDICGRSKNTLFIFGFQLKKFLTLFIALFSQIWAYKVIPHKHIRSRLIAWEGF